MGIGFLPRFILAEDIAAKRVVPVLSDYVSTRLPLYVMFPKGHYVLAKVKAFVDFLVVAMDEKQAKTEPASQSARSKVRASA
jgi:DNA-binding transcriptional LysR family regulator